ncbi:MAG: NAD-dependent epimerase/dehydratase family protein [Candidatus Eisenbacteria bacterium]
MPQVSSSSLPVLVTGATGFVGSHVVDRLLASGVAVRAIVRKTSSLRWLAGKPVEMVEADLRDPERLRAAVAGTRAVLHFGGKIAARSAREFFEANADGTEALARAFASAAPADGSGFFLYCSSLAACGPAPRLDRAPFPHVREEDDPRPVSTYGASKLEGERRLGVLEGRARVVVVRPPVVYGPRDRGILQYFQWLQRGWMLLPGGGGMRISVVHVRDLATAVQLSLDQPRARGIYNAGDGRAYSWQDVGRIAARALGVHPRPVRIPWMFTYLGALASEIGVRLPHRGSPRDPLVSFDKLREMRQTSWACLPEKATREFGFQPRIDIEAGIEETIRWYQEQGWLRGAR